MNFDSCALEMLTDELWGNKLQLCVRQLGKDRIVRLSQIILTWQSFHKQNTNVRPKLSLLLLNQGI